MTENETIHRLERLLETSRSLSADLEVEEILQLLLAAASELTASELASILEYEPETAQFHFAALPWYHRQALKAIRIPLEGSIAGRVFQAGESANVPDVQAEADHYKAVDQAADFQTRSMLAVPIIFRGEAIGVLEAINKTGQAHYTEDDRTILENIASQAAMVMQQAILAHKVQRSLDEMAQLDEMKNDFIAIASHELRTPLGLILGHATFLREVIRKEHRPQLDIIVRNAMRLKDIIDSISNMDNIQRGMASLRRRPVLIQGVIDEVLDSFQEEASQKQILLRKDTGTGELWVEGDVSKIAIAISNLVRNSITFTNPGGHIMVAAEKAPGYVKISVIDDGIGIPAPDLPRVFERFYQVESHLTRKHGGMGLGLAVSKVMVEMHGGRIWAESVEGKGSNFTFLLPLDPNQPEAAGKAFVS
jgi:signal transduction histidine kinase